MDNLKYSEILRLNKMLFDEVKGKPYKVKVLSNVTMNSIKELLEYILHVNQINPIVELGNYDNIIQDSLKCNNDDLVIIFYNLQNIIDGMSLFFEDITDELFNNIKSRICSEIYIIFDNLKESPSVIFNLFSSIEFVSSYSQKSKIESLVDELNVYVNQIKPFHVHLINIEKIISQNGISQSIDLRFYYSSKAPYTLYLLKKYVSSIESIVLRNTGKLKKAIIFDCDNTLWKGVLGEDGFDKIDMSRTSHNGQIYNNIQQIAVYLSKHGVLVGLCSKNNEQDVLEVFSNHTDIVLENNFITIKKINWQDKATNLKSISSELNIGIDSIVFVDDSPFEINLIKEQLPEVVTIQVPTAIYEYPNLLLKNIYKYFNLSLNDLDINKTEIYKKQFERENYRQEFKTIDDYLLSLNISLTIQKDDLSQVIRIAQLTQKTNQFNLTTIRYTENQVLGFIQNANNYVFTISVEDKFGDNGLTGLCIVKRNEFDTKNVIIDTFLMSCRIIGRNIEFAFLDFLVDWFINNDFETINAKFELTKKNEQVQSFYDELGFNLESNLEDSKQYKIRLQDYVKKRIQYINIKN